MRTEGLHGGQRSEALAANTCSFDRKDLSIERSARRIPWSKEQPLVQEERQWMENWRTNAAIMVDVVMDDGLLFCDRDIFVHTRGREEEKVCPNSKGSSVGMRSPNFLSPA